MPLTFHYLDYSPAVRSVDLVIHALELEVDYGFISPFDEHHFFPQFFKMNPLHTVPLLEDEDGLVLWESRSTMTYLVSKYGKDDSLYPSNLRERVEVDQKLHYSNDVFFVLRETMYPLLYHNAIAVPEEQILKIKDVQQNVEKLLEGNKFMAGDSLTVADYSYVTFMDIFEIFSPSESDFPLTQAWFERCKSKMKDFDKVNAPGAEKLKQMIKHNNKIIWPIFQ